MEMRKFGLQLRSKPSSSSASAPKSVKPPPPFAFGDDDDDDIEQEISRHAAKNKSLQKIEEQHKKALEEDPSVFDYDGVYDEMKEKAVQPKIQDKVERKSKYIERLKEAAQRREKEHDVAYERKLLKERSKEDHLYAEKDRFVTGAYKRKLAEQQKWMEEERLRQLQEEKDDVTKKKDMSDFYFSLHQNVAFGAQGGNQTNKKQKEHVGKADAPEPDTSPGHRDTPPAGEPSASSERQEIIGPQVVDEPAVAGAGSSSKEADVSTEDAQKVAGNYKRGDDAIALARERYLARRKSRELS